MRVWLAYIGSHSWALTVGNSKNTVKLARHTKHHSTSCHAPGWATSAPWPWKPAEFEQKKLSMYQADNCIICSMRAFLTRNQHVAIPASLPPHLGDARVSYQPLVRLEQARSVQTELPCQPHDRGKEQSEFANGQSLLACWVRSRCSPSADLWCVAVL